MYRVVPFLVALLLPAVAIADDWLVATVGSAHPGAHRQYCQGIGGNPGIGVEHDLNDRLKFVAGEFRNSVCEGTLYIGAWAELYHFSVGDTKVRPGITLALTDGCGHLAKHCDGYGGGKLVPTPIPVTMFERHGYGVNLMTVYYKEQWVFGVQVKMSVEPFK